MSTSVSVTPRINQITAKCEKLIETLEKLVEIESTEQQQLLLVDINELNEMLPCTTPYLIDLMAHYESELNEFASESYLILLTEIVKKFGKSHGSEDEIPAEVISLAAITDNVNFILETMNVLSDVKLINTAPNFIVQLLEKLLLDESYLTFAFTRMSQSTLEDETIMRTDQFIQQLISLPDKIANRLKSEFPPAFDHRKFSGNLMVNALKCFHISCQVNKMEQLNVYDLEFLSKLISKIFVHFINDKEVLKVSLRLMACLSGQEIYRNNIRELIARLKRAAVQNVAQLAFGNEENKQRLLWMFGDVWKRSSDWTFMLTKKIPLLSFSNDDRIIENLCYFLATEDVNTMQQMLMEMLTVWSTKPHVNDTSFDQHFYVTKFIVLMTKYLPNAKESTEKMKQLLFNGVRIHLESTDQKIKALGMITAETILGMFDNELKDEDKLKFDYAEIDRRIVKDVVIVIRDFPDKAADSNEIIELFDENEVEKFMKELISAAEGREETKTIVQKLEISSAEKPQEAVKPSSPGIKRKSVELDSDDEDDLQPYDDPDDLPRYDQKRPKYLLDLIQAFTSKENLDDPEKFQLSMKSAEEIIKQQLPGHHTDLAIDLLRIFISLDKICYFENFDDTKMKILVEICSIHPKESAQYLCQEFNSESSKYSINRRMLMLDVLAEVAKNLSKLEIKRQEETFSIATKPGKFQNKLMIKLNEELENRNRKDAQKIIRQRLLAKTRRIATKTKAPYEHAGVNQFSDVAGWFFFPLVHGFGRKQMIFKHGTSLKDEVDNTLLVKFLNTISVMMLCAENSVLAPKMAKEIVNMSVFLRYHEESKIRLAVLHMVSTIILAVPRNVLVNEFAQEINEFMNHLGMTVKSTVVNYEPDHECREFAKQLMGMFHDVLYANQ